MIVATCLHFDKRTGALTYRASDNNHRFGLAGREHLYISTNARDVLDVGNSPGRHGDQVRRGRVRGTFSRARRERSL